MSGWNTKATEFVPGQFSFSSSAAQPQATQPPTPVQQQQPQPQQQQQQPVSKTGTNQKTVQQPQQQGKPVPQQHVKPAQQQAKPAQPTIVNKVIEKNPTPQPTIVNKVIEKNPTPQPPNETWEDEEEVEVDESVVPSAAAATAAATTTTTTTTSSVPKVVEKPVPQQHQPPPVVAAVAPEKKTDSKPVVVSPENKSVGPVDDDNDDYDEDEEETVKKVIADDPREHINVVFIGHVDAGKSTISGNILFLTGRVNARTIEKYEREAKEKNRTTWFLAFIMDTNEEERAKGKTVEVGRAHFDTEKKRYTILDAPGHKNYVPNMISGVAQADVAVLVISARKGEFEAGFDRSGQTREHALLAKTLGVKKIIVAINKMDEPTVCWSEERFNTIKKNFSEWLTRDRVYPLKDVEWVPLSGFDGSNMLRPVDSKICPWYKGPPLLTLLDSLQPLARLDASPLRIPVLDRYKEAGKLVILGKVESGIIKTGETLLICPGSMSFTIFQIENDAGVLTVARPGENIKIIVKSGIEEDNIWRGAILCHPDKPPVSTTDFVTQIQILDLLEHKSLFSAGYECVFHIHTAVEEVSVTLLLEKISMKTGKTESKLPKFVQSKDVVVAHLTVNRPTAMEKFDDFPQLGRFTLRDEGKTIALGKILATHAPMKRKKQT